MMRKSPASSNRLTQLVQGHRSHSNHDITVALGYSQSIYDFRRLEVIIRRLRNKAKLTLGIEIPLKTAHRRGYAFTDTIRVVDF